MIAVGCIFLAPFIFVVLTAVMTTDQAVTPSFWPHPFQWSNFAEVFHRIPFLRYTWNTVQIATLSTVGIVLSCVPVAYALARMRWRARQFAFVLVLATLMLPFQVTIVPLYVIWVRVHQIGHMTPLILPSFLGDAFSIFLLRQFFLTIPGGALRRRPRRRRERVADHDPRDRAAREARDRRRGPVPVPLPWNDLFLPLLFLGNNKHAWTLTLALSQFQSRHGAEWNLTMAASLLFMLPVIVLFFLAQRVFVEGVTLTGVKG